MVVLMYHLLLCCVSHQLYQFKDAGICEEIVHIALHPT